MADYKVVISDYIFPELDIEKEMLPAAGVELLIGQCRTATELIELAHDADGMLNTYFEPVDSTIFAACSKLKVVVRYGVGVNTIDIPEATRHGIMVANVPDYCMDEVSDHALGLWLNLGRKIASADRQVRRGDWTIKPLEPVANLRAQTVAIIGLGRLGRMAARKLAVFGVELIFYDPHLPEDLDLDGVLCRKVGLEELCRTADAIFIHAPATRETHHLLNAERFGQMDRQPLIINTARAPLIDTTALVKALERGQVRGAGLDLVEGEQLPADHPLLRFDNVVITPHVAWYSEEAKVNLRRMAVREVIRVLHGGRPHSLLNPEVGID